MPVRTSIILAHMIHMNLFFGSFDLLAAGTAAVEIFYCSFVTFNTFIQTHRHHNHLNRNQHSMLSVYVSSAGLQIFYNQVHTTSQAIFLEMDLTR